MNRRLFLTLTAAGIVAAAKVTDLAKAAIEVTRPAVAFDLEMVQVQRTPKVGYKIDQIRKIRTGELIRELPNNYIPATVLYFRDQKKDEKEGWGHKENPDRFSSIGHRWQYRVEVPGHVEEGSQVVAEAYERAVELYAEA